MIESQPQFLRIFYDNNCTQHYSTRTIAVFPSLWSSHTRSIVGLTHTHKLGSQTYGMAGVLRETPTYRVATH